MTAILQSDKFYWHRYIDTYLRAFAQLGEVRTLVEFGIFRGESTRWLAELFPNADIFAADILPQQPEWPCGPKIFYAQVDQGDRPLVRELLAAIETPIDLIIEDGSHIPQHQAACLADGLARLRPGGLYIVEDMGTSHPAQQAFAHYSLREDRRQPNVLNVLLAIQHLKDIGRDISPEICAQLSAPDFFSIDEIAMLAASMGRVEIFKRTQLPLRCYVCGAVDFDYVEWRCRCGAELYEPADSMTALVWKRSSAATTAKADFAA
jgi:predicted O-methyltransferase YrrM